MIILYIALALVGLLLFILLLSLLCFYLTFYSPKRKNGIPLDELKFPLGDDYAPFMDEIKGWVKLSRETPCTHMSVKTPDGLTLRGKLYEYEKGAPVDILFHGYKGNAERDMSAGIERCFKMGRSALLVDQRAGGYSDGHVISFGVKERHDVLLWVDAVIKLLGDDVKIFLSGISMGAATVAMASCLEMPRNVLGILCDCGYTSPKKIISSVLKNMHLPVFIFYPLVRLGAMVYGGFDPSSVSAEECVKNSRYPILFIHGGNDNFVPTYMSRELYDACTSKKSITIIEGAAHGLSYPVSKDEYVKALTDFFCESASTGAE